MAQPKSLKELVQLDLARAERLIRKIDDPGGIDPQFRIGTPEGDYWIAMTLPPEQGPCLEQMRMIGLFMAWKQAIAFTLASELVTPDSVYCYGATYKQELAALVFIKRDPLEFSPIQWLGPEQIGDEIRALLPKGSHTIDAATLAELETWFGRMGKFPAVHIPSGRIGL